MKLIIGVCICIIYIIYNRIISNLKYKFVYNIVELFWRRFKCFVEVIDVILRISSDLEILKIWFYIIF